MREGYTEFLSQEILFGLSLIELAALLLGLMALSWLVRRLSAARRQSDQIRSQTAGIRCYACGWTGTGSKHTLRCPKCGNKALSD
jgi:hypothetical protein